MGICDDRYRRNQKNWYQSLYYLWCHHIKIRKKKHINNILTKEFNHIKSKLGYPNNKFGIRHIGYYTLSAFFFFALQLLIASIITYIIYFNTVAFSIYIYLIIGFFS